MTSAPSSRLAAFARSGVEPATALALCLAVVLWQALSPDYRRPIADALVYARYALDMVEAWRVPGRSWLQAVGQTYAPGYPAFLSLFALADGGLERTLRCVIDPAAACDLRGLTPLFAVQGFLAALSVWGVFMAAGRLTADRRMAWLALVLVLATKINAGYAAQLLTEALAFPFFFLFLWLLAVMLTTARPPVPLTVACGLALAAAALVRPSYGYLVYFMVPVLAARGLLSSPRAAAPAAGFALGAALLLAPWSLRGLLFAGDPAAVDSAGARILIERLAYNLMTMREWAVSFIFWLPDFGDGLGKTLFDRADYVRLTWYDPASFYSMGRGDFFLRLHAAADATGHPTEYLIKTYIIPDLAKHVVVTLALAWRGMWAGKYVGLAGFLLLPLCLHWFRSRGRAWAFALFCLPGLFMLGLYAFVSVNVVRYNDPLVAVFALSGAVALVALWDRLAARRGA